MDYTDPFSAAASTRAATATKYSTTAALAFLLYEHTITFDLEVRFVWNRRWSFGKALFLINRYFGSFALIFNVVVFFNGSLTDKFCSGFFWWLDMSSTLAILTAEIILQARLFAVYQCSKRLLITMATLCFTQGMIAIIIAALGLPAGLARPTNSLTGCYVGSAVRATYFTTWLPPLFFETFLCFLMLYKWWQTYQEDFESPLLSVIIHDRCVWVYSRLFWRSQGRFSILYYLAILAALFANALVYFLCRGAAPNAVVGELGSNWVIAVPCAMSTRLLLNMRKECFHAHETMILPLSAGDEWNCKVETGGLRADNGYDITCHGMSQ